ncbi:MAG: inner membrane CreD family protein [Saprospiraceae bacterium]|nr:inner membrane CreD family protein [Saprospiraceae bacterium]
MAFPETLSIDGKIETESKYRSLYKVLLYKSGLSIKGNFKLPNVALTNIKSEDLLLEEASLLTGVSDPKGIQDKIAAQLEWQTRIKIRHARNDFLIDQILKPQYEQFIANYDHHGRRNKSVPDFRQKLF